MDRTIPKRVNGVPVHESGTPLLVNGERWVTLVPDADDDGRIWEFSLDSGRVLLTVNPDDAEA